MPEKGGGSTGNDLAVSLAMMVFPADSSSVSLGKSLAIFEPQFPHL